MRCDADCLHAQPSIERIGGAGQGLQGFALCIGLNNSARNKAGTPETAPEELACCSESLTTTIVVHSSNEYYLCCFNTSNQEGTSLLRDLPSSESHSRSFSQISNWSLHESDDGILQMAHTWPMDLSFGARPAHQTISPATILDQDGRGRGIKLAAVVGIPTIMVVTQTLPRVSRIAVRPPLLCRIYTRG